jgi:hypothetical protein
MNEPSSASEAEPKTTRQRSKELDLELWTHYSSFGGQDKNTMVTIASWLLGGSAVMLTYIWNNLISPNSDIKSIWYISQPVKALGFAILGMCVSILAAYISLLYGGYANWNWEKAKRIAENREWKDLLPSHEKSLEHSLNAAATRLLKTASLIRGWLLCLGGTFWEPLFHASFI